jgi:cullin-4
VEKERMGETVDRARLKRLLRMFASLGVYQESFEKPFLEASNEFYRAEGGRQGLTLVHVSAQPEPLLTQHAP